MLFRSPDAEFFKPGKKKVFVSADEASFYNYEKVEKHLKYMIKKNFKVGDKLPSMGHLSDEMGVSSNTIRKALQNLGEQGFVTFSRGRYGGTFIAKIPEVDTSKSFQWVSINPETIKTYHRKDEEVGAAK